MLIYSRQRSYGYAEWFEHFVENEKQVLAVDFSQEDASSSLDLKSICEKSLRDESPHKPFKLLLWVCSSSRGLPVSSGDV